MNGPVVADATEQGFDALDVTGDDVSIRVVPALGAKLTSLRDRRRNREWLWRADAARMPDVRHQYGTSYIEVADTGGWDECFPTVAPCSFAGHDLPDHGELWTEEPETDVDRIGGGIAIRSRWTGRAFGYEFERTITVPGVGNAVRFDYAVTATGDEDLAAIWSSHPLLRIEPGSRVRLPDDARVRVWSTSDATAIDGEQPMPWPPLVTGPSGGVALDPLPGPEAGVAAKVWTDPLALGWAELVHPDGATLRFDFDPAEIPQVGVWFNLGGWAGDGGDPYWNLALEPCIGAQDGLDHAVSSGLGHLTVPAGGRRRWTLATTLR